MGSPLSASSLLNTPVATPGKLSANVLVEPAVVEGHAEDHSEVPEVPQVVIKPDPEPSPNESYIQRVINKIIFHLTSRLPLVDIKLTSLFKYTKDI